MLTDQIKLFNHFYKHIMDAGIITHPLTLTLSINETATKLRGKSPKSHNPYRAPRVSPHLTNSLGKKWCYRFMEHGLSLFPMSPVAHSTFQLFRYDLPSRALPTNRTFPRVPLTMAMQKMIFFIFIFLIYIVFLQSSRVSKKIGVTETPKKN